MCIRDRHESSSACDICVMHLNTYKNNLVQVQKYLQLAMPYLYSFRDTEIRKQLVRMFKVNSLQKGITILSTPTETDRRKSCREIERILDNFKRVFPSLYDEIKQIRSTLEESIIQEQFRRPSLRVLDLL